MPIMLPPALQVAQPELLCPPFFCGEEQTIRTHCPIRTLYCLRATLLGHLSADEDELEPKVAAIA